MNYANMIEEKNLKKTFIIATLVSTIIGTFTTGMGLYDRVESKRKQKKTDAGQDDKIKAIQDEMKEQQRQHKRALEDKDRENENRLRDSLGGSGPMIRTEYNRDFARFGDKFAVGDATTQNQLQGQVITLQGTVIQLLDEALRTGRLDNVNKLYNAAELARIGSIDALQGQAQRMLQAAPVQRPMTVRRISSQPSVAPSMNGRKNSNALTKAMTFAPAPSKTSSSDFDPLFCSYSETLQRDPQFPLDPSFQGGANQCRDCRNFLDVEQGKAWKITKEIVRERISTVDYDEEVVEDRVYLLMNRFMVKSHARDGSYPCILCNKFREKDIVCDSPKQLVWHIQTKHDAKEYVDVDIKEIGREIDIKECGTRPQSPPPPQNITPPLTKPKKSPPPRQPRHRDRITQKPKGVLKKAVHWVDGR